MFWSRIVGLMLMLLVGFVLRVEPDLRTALAEAAMDGMTRMTGRDAPQATEGGAPTQSALPRDRVKVNRFGVQDADSASASRESAQAQAEAIGQRLRSVQVGE
jgi:hypothetical protein